MSEHHKIYSSSVDNASNDAAESHSCYAHNQPYFKNPVHPYDYTGDWDLEDEWNRRQGRGDSERSGQPGSKETPKS
jgi:hypothetical protein